MQVTFEQIGNTRIVTVWQTGNSKKLMPKDRLEVDMRDAQLAQQEIVSFLEKHGPANKVQADL